MPVKKVFLQLTAGLAIITLLMIAIQSDRSEPAYAVPSTQTLNMLGAVIDAQHPVGSADPYTDVSIDGGATWNPAIITTHPWSPATGVNGWINCQSVTANSYDRCAQVVDGSNPLQSLFRYRFWVASDYANGLLSGSFNADNYAKFYINGTDSAHCFMGCAGSGFGGGQNATTIAAQNSQNPGQPAAIQNLLQAGWNTFYVALVDVGGQSGITYNLQLTVTSEFPITVAAPGRLVTFDAQGGTASALSASVGFNQALSTITLATATRTGYTFDGWYTAASGGTLVDPTYAAATVPTTDLTLYAHWTPLPNVVTFDPRGGTSTSLSESVAYNNTLASITMPTATRAGYTFDGWYTASTNGTLVNSTYAAATTPTTALTLYAHWTPRPSTVTFNGQGATPSSSSGVVAPGQTLSTLTLPTISRPGYTFAGWYTASSGGQLVDATYAASLTPTNDFDLYAQWVPIPLVAAPASTALGSTGINLYFPLSIAGLTMLCGLALLISVNRRRNSQTN